LQNTLVYRWNFFFKAVMGFVPLLSTIFLWNTIYRGHDSLGGYTATGMITYYLLLVIVDSLTTPSDDEFEIAADIREGRLSTVLMKPVNFLAYRFMLFAANRLTYSAVAAPPVAMGLWLLSRYLAPIPLAETGLWFLLAIVGSAVLQFLIAYLTALLAFWVLEIGPIVFTLYSLEHLAGGHIFPLDALPAALQRLALSLPFAYEFFFPVAVLQGRLTGSALAQGFATQWLWVALLLGVERLVWRSGLKRYAATGG
jgi:ABC-2 type transport system permease protein